MRKIWVAAAAAFLAWQAPATAETGEVNGIALHYDVSGAGEPLLLLHGFGSCAAEWAPVAQALAKTYRVIAIDMRGHGQSTNPSGRFTHRQSADDVRALMVALKIPTARAMGFSSGGMTLLQLATRYPDRLSRLVLVSATTHFPEQARAMLRDVSVEAMPAPVMARYKACATRGDSQVRTLVTQFRGFADSQDDMNLGAADLARISASTLIVHGDRDPFFPVAIPVAMYAGIPRSALWIVPEGDHAPRAGADVQAFLAVTADFLSKPDRVGGPDARR